MVKKVNRFCKIVSYRMSKYRILLYTFFLVILHVIMWGRLEVNRFYNDWLILTKYPFFLFPIYWLILSKASEFLWQETVQPSTFARMWQLFISGFRRLLPFIMAHGISLAWFMTVLTKFGNVMGLYFFYAISTPILLYAAAFAVYSGSAIGKTGICRTIFFLVIGIIALLPLIAGMAAFISSFTLLYILGWAIILIFFISFSCRTFWKRRYGGLVFFGIAFAISLTCHAIFDWAASIQLGRAERRLSAAGMPTKASDFIAPQIPESENSAAIYLKAIIPLKSFHGKYPNAMRLVNHWPLGSTVPVVELTELREKLLRDPDFIKMYNMVKDADKMPGFYLDIDYSNGFWMPEEQSFTKDIDLLCKFVLARMNVLIYEKKYHEAMDDGLLLYRLYRKLEYDYSLSAGGYSIASPFWIAPQLYYLFQKSRGYLSYEDYRKLLSETGEPFHPDAYIDGAGYSLLALVESVTTGRKLLPLCPCVTMDSFREIPEDFPEKSLPAIIYGVICVHAAYHELGTGRIHRILHEVFIYVARPAIKVDTAFALNTFRMLKDLHHLPVRNQREFLKRWKEKYHINKIMPNRVMSYKYLEPWLRTNGHGQLDYFKGKIAKQRGLRLVIALEMFRAETGAYPDRLSMLAQRILDEIPLDPFIDEQFHYRKQKNGYILYSVGPNLKDDDGTNNAKEKDDILLWKVLSVSLF